MSLRIDPSSATPPYDQLRLQIIEQIGAGELPSGTRLPSVRRLAADLSLAPNTVARAYRELEAASYVRTAGRNGTVVAERGVIPQDEVGEARQLTEEYFAAMRALGWGPRDIVGHVKRFALGTGPS